jgi:hypothetical protein
LRRHATRRTQRRTQERLRTCAVAIMLCQHRFRPFSLGKNVCSGDMHATHTREHRRLPVSPTISGTNCRKGQERPAA